MRILICNKFWYRRGGDCIYAMNLAELLRAHGHEVAEFAMDCASNEASGWKEYFPSEVGFGGAGEKLRYALRCLGYGGVASRFRALLDAFRPDVVHLNNIHSQLSPVIAEEAARRGVRVVWTLHDYKLLCPRYDCLRRGETVCEQCFKDKSAVLRNACMKNSRAASAVAWAETLKWNRRRLQSSVDSFICPSSFMAAKMAEGGFNPDKLVHLCNFVDASKCGRSDYSQKGDYYCYVGRLSHEKGVSTLAKAAAGLPYSLVVVGDGSLAGSLPQAPNIEYAGKKDWAGVKEIVGGARFTVVPSEWYENNPLSIIEALCLGTPVLGAEIGGIPELIEPGRSGGLFCSGDEAALASAIRGMFEQNFDYKVIALESQERFSQENYYEELIKLYL
ncbi:MAG: glycosyltransferase [Bacteroidales bacterium]|nr:glycosyltransferase [Bacteroidales bacterium]